MNSKTFPSDLIFLNKLKFVVEQLKNKSNRSIQEEYIFKKLEGLYLISMGERNLEMNQKKYSDVVRWLDELGDISRSQLGKDFLDLHDYFADYYTIPEKGNQ